VIDHAHIVDDQAQPAGSDPIAIIRILATIANELLVKRTNELEHALRNEDAHESEVSPFVPDFASAFSRELVPVSDYPLDPCRTDADFGLFPGPLNQEAEAFGGNKAGVVVEKDDIGCSRPNPDVRVSRVYERFDSGSPANSGKL